MQEWLNQLCGVGFMPHGQCYLWTPSLVWLHAVSDSLIALAYFSIPAALLYFVRKRRDIPYPAIFLMFALFIVSCGSTHLLEVWTIWHGHYYLTGLVKAVTAVVSLATAVALARVMPHALQLAGPADLRRLNESLEERVRLRTADLEGANRRLQTEIAERQKAEAEVTRLNELLQRRVHELQVLFDVLPVGVGIADDPACASIRANNELARILGLPAAANASLSAPDGQAPVNFRVFHQDREVGPEELPMQVSARENRAIFAFEETVRLSDGRALDLLANAIPLHDERGAVTGCVGTFQDVTELRQAARERLELERKIQETQKLESLGVLAGGIAHDFNNLLTAVLGNVSLAMMPRHSASDMRPYLKQIEAAARRAAELCNQMLAYSGRGRFVLNRLDLNELIAETTHLVSISIGKTCVLRLNPAPSLPAVTADPTQLRQIIMNLVINASDAIGARGGVIALTTGVARIDQDYRATLRHASALPLGDYVFLEVSDNGCGMDGATLERIFEPFFSTKFTGRGLGLAAVLGIIRGHKGALKVYSEPGRGTTFKVFLPVTEGAAEKENASAPAAPDARPRGRVLVADDEESVRTVAARMLEELGYTVELASDGREAVERFRADPSRFHLVLLDLTMPHLDGEETFRQLRHLRPGVRVVLMSGFNKDDAISRFTGKGLAGFVQKPFTIETLHAAVREVATDE